MSCRRTEKDLLAPKTVIVTRKQSTRGFPKGGCGPSNNIEEMIGTHTMKGIKVTITL